VSKPVAWIPKRLRSLGERKHLAQREAELARSQYAA